MTPFDLIVGVFWVCCLLTGVALASAGIGGAVMLIPTLLGAVIVAERDDEP